MDENLQFLGAKASGHYLMMLVFKDLKRLSDVI
jgi:hypothetical protein